VQHIAAAAPQLEQLHFDLSCPLSPQGASAIASLASLASLHVALGPEGGAQLARALRALPRLTLLSLRLPLTVSTRQQLPSLLEALGQLTGLSSLELRNIVSRDTISLAPLLALQQLMLLELELF
jgi:hypothetical protein